jgi:Delta carbonic anhydrase
MSDKAPEKLKEEDTSASMPAAPGAEHLAETTAQELDLDNANTKKTSNTKTSSTSSNIITLKRLYIATGLLGAATLGLLVAVIILAIEVKNGSSSSSSSTTSTEVVVFPTTPPPAGTNVCAGQDPADNLPNVACVIDGVEQTGEQSGVNITQGYQGLRNTTAVPITVPYYQVGMCPVNVHWHLGAEHYSLGQFDETGSGPTEINERRRLAGETRLGFQCKLYDESDPKFTTEYQWQHCVDMEVGQTYEVHWPHSAGGACGTLNQYQTPFEDGVFCIDGAVTNTALQVGVQGQVYTVVNDESYYYPDLIRGMIVDTEKNMGVDVVKYTGSTTGTSRDNDLCSQYAPITWQVDRQCHLISASSLDKLCADMRAQRDDMTKDLEPHGSRPLVADDLAANNHHPDIRRHLLRG